MASASGIGLGLGSEWLGSGCWIGCWTGLGVGSRIGIEIGSGCGCGRARGNARGRGYSLSLLILRDADSSPLYAAGLILVPIESAASAEVMFGGRGHSAPHDLATAQGGPVHDSAELGGVERRAGVASSAGWTLHDHTYADLASCTATEPRILHEWVAAECERTQQLPEAFREVWSRIEAGEHSLQEDPNGSGELGVSELHARLRRQVRHSMHVMMQQDNPGSYYADVEHMAPR